MKYPDYFRNETVISGDFEKTFANISSSLKKEPFDKYFYPK